MKELEDKIYNAYQASPQDNKESSGTVLFSDPHDPEYAAPRPIDKDLFLEYQKYKSANERSAWAAAIHILRKFRARGIDVEPGLKTSAALKRFLADNENLGGYQQELNRILADAKTKLFVRPP